MKRLLILAVAITAAACAMNRNGNPYEKPPFYAQFLNTGSVLDARIQYTLRGLQADPESSVLHNELGALLVQKGFPKDAEREFERAINNDSRFYPAWYNLGLVRAANGNHVGARRAFHRTVRLRKGHGPALFQLGLMAEKSGDNQSAIAYYAKAFRHNRELLDVKHNPRLLDSKLVPFALLANYERRHAAESADFKGAPIDYVQPRQDREAASPQAAPASIVTPVAPATDPGTQTPPPAVTNT
ncbi:MAG TPA: tetratricopeptide repeat protein [Thermoanaerobaculia bacterium]|nr:tetratricopeptide repeat protein [Thermoanaerobaculia bacterium]